MVIRRSASTDQRLPRRLAESLGLKPAQIGQDPGGNEALPVGGEGGELVVHGALAFDLPLAEPRAQAPVAGGWTSVPQTR